MATKFRKIDPRVWRDERFVTLTNDQKLIALYCLTAQSNRCGIFVFSPAMAAEELGTSPQTFREGFREVCRTLNWEWDEGSRVLYFPTWWKYNPPEHANVLRGNLKDIADVPTTPLLAKFFGNVRYLAENLRPTLREGYPEPPPDHPPVQEQEQEQDNTPLTPQGGSVRSEAAKAKAKRKADPGEHPLFAEFYAAYPRRERRPAAARAFARLNPDRVLLDKMLAAIVAQKRVGCLRPQTTEDGRSTIPHPSSWLNDRRWEDEPVALPRTPGHAVDAPGGRLPPYSGDFGPMARPGGNHVAR